jgi:hypothetical protein
MMITIVTVMDDDDDVPERLHAYLIIETDP